MMLNLTPLAWIHTILSLVALVAGVIVVLDMIGSKFSARLTAAYLLTSIAANLTGFILPADRILPSHIVGVLSSMALIVAVIGLYVRGLAGGWRRAYAIAMTVSVYFLAFVTVAQAFLKISALQPLAPTQTEPPFAIAQLVVIAAFVALGWAATTRFHASGSGLGV
ncbi:MAG: hypothetical protein BGP06_07215 [Rhizobiales bacterium 65-9]|mgnify:FL=1|nr:hypothetical protein [Hyphomicrobiales bacterium]OJY35753.1 MAG: hypothetical protein BGP06_07215 [Rhizobiales bacterium 65-9]